MNNYTVAEGAWDCMHESDVLRITKELESVRKGCTNQDDMNLVNITHCIVLITR